MFQYLILVIHHGDIILQDTVGAILEVVLISLAKVHMDLLSNHSARFVDEQDTLLFKCFHRFDLLHSNPQTTAGVPASTSAMEPFRQVPQSFDPLHSSSQALVTTQSLPPDDAWYLDNGASHHTTPDVTAIDTKATYHGSNKLVVGNGSALPITHIGNSYIPTPRPLQLKNILLVPALKKNLISISQFTLHNNVLVNLMPHVAMLRTKLPRTSWFRAG